jgi:hypothetical protein
MLQALHFYYRMHNDLSYEVKMLGVEGVWPAQNQPPPLSRAVSASLAFLAAMVHVGWSPMDGNGAMATNKQSIMRELCTAACGPHLRHDDGGGAKHCPGHPPRDIPPPAADALPDKRSHVGCVPSGQMLTFL